MLRRQNIGQQIERTWVPILQGRRLSLELVKLPFWGLGFSEINTNFICTILMVFLSKNYVGLKKQCFYAISYDFAWKKSRKYLLRSPKTYSVFSRIFSSNAIIIFYPSGMLLTLRYKLVSFFTFSWSFWSFPAFVFLFIYQKKIQHGGKNICSPSKQNDHKLIKL